MKKIVGIFATVLLIVTLAGCGNKASSAQSDKQDSARQSSVKKAESKKKIAKLRSENESLKKKESESTVSSSQKAASESISAANSSVQAASESMATASSSTQAVSEDSSSNSNSGSLAPKLLSEDELPWGGMGQRPGFDVSLQEYTDKGLTLAGFKLISGSVYGVYFEGSDSPTITVDVSTGNVLGN